MNALPMVARCMEHQATDFDDEARNSRALVASQGAYVAMRRGGCGEFTVSIWSVVGIQTSLMAIKEG